MSQNNPTQEKANDDILMDVRKVGKYTITPMSFGQLATITPMLSPLVDRVSEFFPSGTPNTPDVIKCAMVMLPDFMPIMAILLNEEVQELQKLSAQEGLELLITLWSANAAMLVNFFQCAVTLARVQTAE